MESTENPIKNRLSHILTGDTSTRFRKWRNFKDVQARYLMTIGGVSVIFAIVLIAFYLLYVVLPMFRPATLEAAAVYQVPGSNDADTIYYAMEEQHEIGMRAMSDGRIVFFNTSDGDVIKEYQLPIDDGVSITAFSAGDPTQSLLVYGLSDGTALLVVHKYEVTYPDDIRTITPSIIFPLGESVLEVEGNFSPIKSISAQWNGEEATVALMNFEGRLFLLNAVAEKSFLTDEITITASTSEIPGVDDISAVILDVDQRELYLTHGEGFISYYDIRNKDAPRLIQQVGAVLDDTYITNIEFLSGGISILVGDSKGNITQWFPVRDEDNNYTLEKIRSFKSQEAPIVDIATEYFRKGFLTVDENGVLGIFHTTASRTVLLEDISDVSLTHIAIAPRANAMLVQDSDNELHFFNVHNEHPEISWSSIWGKVWYESRDKPEYIWQSSSASSDFEPKFSLTPLAFGTLKAAFYAMLFAVPLAIMGAVYTAYFMAARVRNLVKSSIEIMAALPTVILGFLAGLWLAPWVEGHLPGMFMIFILVPASVLAAAWAWNCLPESVRSPIPDGWEAVLLVPIIIISVSLCVLVSAPIEHLLFDGNMPLWLSTEMGISYDQRNSLVVGIAIGFAVIPTIFSISEDAIFGVPKSLTTGSLALGATPWQTMIRVVLLTASPGIFSAVMIGLGRAVGETMIVVMATGNTAIMDMNIFQGFRALSANIAVEMPESEVGSTHYRILFLAGLVLFAATFVFNTVAELVRQKLRTKYSTL